jgi:uncharacterized protein DUF4124
MCEIMSPITFLCKLVTILVVFQTSAFAEMYKWIDEDGNTHYTQNPPSGTIQAEIIKPPSKVDIEGATKKSKDQKNKADELMENRHKLAEDERKAKEEQDKKEESCKQARAQLARYQRPRVSVKDEEGNVTRITEEKRQAEIERIKENINKVCE